MVLKLQSSTR